MTKPVNKIPPVHPGEILADEMAELDLSAHKLGAAIKVPAKRITGIMNGAHAITADTALRLAASTPSIANPVGIMRVSSAFSTTTAVSRSPTRMPRITRRLKRSPSRSLSRDRESDRLLQQLRRNLAARSRARGLLPDVPSGCWQRVPAAVRASGFWR